MHNNIMPSLDLTLKGATAGGATVINHDVTLLDHAVSVFLFVKFGAIDIQVNTPPQILVQHADASDYSDVETIADLTQTIVAGMANKQVLLELVRPTKKYIRLSVVRTGAANSIEIAEQGAIPIYAGKAPLAAQTADYVRDTALCPSSS